jgi:hypothetical protein
VAGGVGLRPRLIEAVSQDQTLHWTVTDQFVMLDDEHLGSRRRGASGEHAVRSLQLSSALACYAALKAGGVNWAFWQVKRLVCNGARDCFDVIDQCEPCGTIISALEGGQPVGVTRDDGESPPAGSSGVNWDASTVVVTSGKVSYRSYLDSAVTRRMPGAVSNGARTDLA